MTFSTRFRALFLMLLFSCLAAPSTDLYGQAVPAELPSSLDSIDWAGSPAAPADRLFAQIWMEDSPEYRALCLQAYNAALWRVRERVEDAPVVEGKPSGPSGRPLAIVADLDETILDNGGYQRELVLRGIDYSRKTWDAWVSRRIEVRLVPGAKEFLESLAKLGVTPVFISNRPDSLRIDTIETLRGLGIDTEGLENPADARLLLRQDTSDKEERRRQALKKFEIIAFLGDNLGDFPELVGRDHEERHQGVAHFRELWGVEWFVFPNPAYGDWTIPLRGKAPKEYLRELPRLP